MLAVGDLVSRSADLAPLHAQARGLQASLCRNNLAVRAETTEGWPGSPLRVVEGRSLHDLIGTAARRVAKKTTQRKLSELLLKTPCTLWCGGHPPGRARARRAGPSQIPALARASHPAGSTPRVGDSGHPPRKMNLPRPAGPPDMTSRRSPPLSSSSLSHRWIVRSPRGEYLLRLPRAGESQLALDPEALEEFGFFANGWLEWRAPEALVGACSLYQSLTGIRIPVRCTELDQATLGQVRRELKQALRAGRIVYELLSPAPSPGPRSVDDAPSIQSSDPPVPPRRADAGTRAWVEVSLALSDGSPCRGEPCLVVDAQGKQYRAHLDDRGEYRFKTISEGPCLIDFPSFCPSVWLPGATPGSCCTVHIVQQGEHIGTIAHRHRLGSVQAIWDHPDNRDLRALRGSPLVLFPGDPVRVPERAEITARLP